MRGRMHARAHACYAPAVDDIIRDDQRVAPLKGRSQRGHLIQDASKGPDVGLLAIGLRLNDLRTLVEDRPYHRIHHRGRVSVRALLGEPKIRKLDNPVLAETNSQNVRRPSAPSTTGSFRLTARGGGGARLGRCAMWAVRDWGGTRLGRCAMWARDGVACCLNPAGRLTAEIIMLDGVRSRWTTFFSLCT